MKTIGFILSCIIALTIYFVGAITAFLAVDNIIATTFTEILAVIVYAFSILFGMYIAKKFYKWFKSKLK